MAKRDEQELKSQKIKTTFYLKPEEKERLLDVKILLEQNPSQHYTIPQLSKKALMNEFKLKKGFRFLFNKSIHDFHLAIRMKEAQELMNNTNLSLEEIAMKIGYHYSSSFIVAFKKLYKITPASFRRNNRK